MNAQAGKIALGKISLIGLGLVLSLPTALRAQDNADVQKVVTELNAAAAKFQSAQADFSWDQLQAVVSDHQVQTGTIYFDRKKGSTQVAAYILKENGQDSPKTVTFNGTEANYYVPKINQVTVIKAGDNKAQWESFLTLGFGGSGKDLEATWKVSYMGNEKLDGVQVDKLDLVPLQANVANLFSHVTIWIDPVRGISLKQIFYEGQSGDMRTATYTNIRYNVPIAPSVFQLKLPKGVSTVVK
jgi:outer membrane lipoprotein-sorting protein